MPWFGQHRRAFTDHWSAHIIFGADGQPAILQASTGDQETPARANVDEYGLASALELEIPFDPQDPLGLAPSALGDVLLKPSPTQQDYSVNPSTTYEHEHTTLVTQPKPTATPVLSTISSSMILLGASSTTNLLPSSSTTDATLPTDSSTLQPKSASHDPRKAIGIALGVVCAIAFLGTILAWFLRQRSRRRRRVRSHFSWSPNPDSGFPHTSKPSGDTEKGLRNDDTLSIYDRGKDAGEPKRSDSYLKAMSISGSFSPLRRAPHSPFADPPPQRCVSENLRPHAPQLSSFAALQPAPVPEIRVQSAHADGQGATGSPPQSLASPRQMPGGGHAFGSLRVANMMPGDRMSSGSEGSTRLTVHAPSSALMGSEFGTPRELAGVVAPRFMTLRDGGLDMPRAGRTDWDKAPQSTLSPPKPAFMVAPTVSPTLSRLEAQIPGGDLTPGTAGWAASIRANLATALATVTEYAPFRATEAGAAEGKDTLTPLPVRHGSARRSRLRDVEWHVGTSEEEEATELSRTSTVIDHEVGVVDIKKPEKMFTPTSTRSHRHLLSRASSKYSLKSVSSDESTAVRVPGSVPLLSSDERGPLQHAPKTPRLARGLSTDSSNTSSDDEHVRSGAACALERIRERHIGRPSDQFNRAHRPKLALRTSWSDSEDDAESANEATSPLTDDEKRAQRMLMERRKANMGHAVGVGRGGKMGHKKTVKRAGSGRGKRVL